MLVDHLDGQIFYDFYNKAKPREISLAIIFEAIKSYEFLILRDFVFNFVDWSIIPLKTIYQAIIFVEELDTVYRIAVTGASFERSDWPVDRIDMDCFI